MAKEFIFGKTVYNDNFISREDDIKKLGTHFKSGVNTILSSPRRWGKTSLVKKVKSEIESKELRIVYLDIFSCRDEYEFYNAFSEAILKECTSKFDEWKNIASSFLARLNPKITFDVSPEQEYSVSLGISPKTHSAEEVLNLPEIIAKKNNINIVVCIDEFQQIGEFTDPVTILKKMRDVWQHHQHTTYCLFGSKKHLMNELFQSKNQPFYKFGSQYGLDLIKTDAWVDYIRRQFKKSGKEISEKLATEICDFVENHSSYVQQLAWITFIQTKTIATNDNLNFAKEELLNENSALFTQQVESLTSYQMNFLRAIIDNVHTDYGISEIRENYKLGSSSNIIRLKKSMINKELVEKRLDGGFYISDPVLKKWLKRIL